MFLINPINYQNNSINYLKQQRLVEHHADNTPHLSLSDDQPIYFLKSRYEEKSNLLALTLIELDNYLPYMFNAALTFPLLNRINTLFSNCTYLSKMPSNISHPYWQMYSYRPHLILKGFLILTYEMHVSYPFALKYPP